MNNKLAVIDSLQRITNQIESYFTDGHTSGADTLLLYGGVKALAKKMDELAKKDTIKDVLFTEFDKFGEKTVKTGGYKFTKRPFVRYTYDQVGHPFIDMQKFVNDQFEELVKEPKTKAAELAKSNALIKDDIVAININVILQLQKTINEMFVAIYDNFEEGSDILNIQINPAKMSSSESIVVTQDKS